MTRDWSGRGRAWWARLYFLAESRRRHESCNKNITKQKAKYQDTKGVSLLNSRSRKAMSYCL